MKLNKEAEGKLTVLDLNGVGARLQVGLDDAVKFLEGGETRRAHPDDEVLILEVGDHSANARTVSEGLFGLRRLQGAYRMPGASDSGFLNLWSTSELQAMPFFLSGTRLPLGYVR